MSKEHQQQFDQSAQLLTQANKLHLKLCDLEREREDSGLEFSYRLSSLIRRSNARGIRRFKTAMTHANAIIAEAKT